MKGKREVRDEWGHGEADSDKERRKERKIALANEKETTGDGEDKLWSQERTNNRKADKRSNS